MSVFISYNKNDDEFVEKLSKALIHHNIPIWRDKWQIGLGDSIIDSIQDALEKAPFACVVLSNNSLKSKWVQRELKALLVRELDEDKLSILPLVIDDCELPLFLRDKLYADFREDFDAGVKMIVNAVADKYNLFSGKFTNERISTSFGTDIIIYKKALEINIDIISEDEYSEYFILTKIKLMGNEKTLKIFKTYQENSKSTLFIKEIMEVCQTMPSIKNKRVVIGGNKLGRESFEIDAEEKGLNFKVTVDSKKVGIDNGKYVVFNLGALFTFYVEK